jgi:hypothetical protein
LSGDHAAARAALASALDARQHSQSASLLLAALDLHEGEGDRAHLLAARALAERAGDDDPWRLFLYGRYPELPVRVANLRRAVRQ